MHKYACDAVSRGLETWILVVEEISDVSEPDRSQGNVHVFVLKAKVGRILILSRILLFFAYFISSSPFYC